MNEAERKLITKLTKERNKSTELQLEANRLFEKSKESFRDLLKIHYLKVGDKVLYNEKIMYIINIGYTSNHNYGFSMLYNLTDLSKKDKLPKRAINGVSVRECKIEKC